ncbi:hypothetical protein EX30DRAFT_183863 [Ascodesmis nigricans]|uniref:Uncharacterized protein n=1 Tax=Ascodesmis nigricans TaxID=341454 RepID=A0A4S2N069_9PEZI|nr:hypothetical protein EX30DRAFT_183863 [Ascodesmis nigricans]
MPFFFFGGEWSRSSCLSLSICWYRCRCSSWAKALDFLGWFFFLCLIFLYYFFFLHSQGMRGERYLDIWGYQSVYLCVIYRKRCFYFVSAVFFFFFFFFFFFSSGDFWVFIFVLHSLCFIEDRGNTIW